MEGLKANIPKGQRSARLRVAGQDTLALASSWLQPLLGAHIACSGIIGSLDWGFYLPVLFPWTPHLNRTTLPWPESSSPLLLSNQSFAHSHARLAHQLSLAAQLVLFVSEPRWRLSGQVAGLGCYWM